MLNKKNVILMFIDDLGYGDISAFNENSKIQTPAIDALTRNGVSFTDCHSTSALCTPSRYGLLTGRYNWRSELKQGVLPGGSDPLIEPGRKTIANLFKEAGYYTACVGKWHLGLGWERKPLDGSEYGVYEEVQKKKNIPGAAGFILDGMNIDYEKPLKVSPNDFGFDYFFGTAASLDQPPYVYIENRKALAVPDHVSGVFQLDRVNGTDQQKWQWGPEAPGYDFRKVMPDMQKKVLSIIDEHQEDPFFIYYPCHAVHGPLLPPVEYEGRSGLNLYADTVLYLNDLVAELVQKLKDTGLYENTVIFFASDNGCSGVADYPALLAKGHNPSYIFRGKKAHIYEGGHRVPLVISNPEIFNEGRKTDALVCLSDLFETFRTELGLERTDDAGEDSLCLSGLINGTVDAVRESVVHSSGVGCFSLRKKDWKLELTRNAGAGMFGPENDADGVSDAVPYQLYNLNSDIHEHFNLAPFNQKLAKEMMKELIRIIEDGRSTEGEKQENTVPSWAQLSQLKELAGE